MRGLGSIPTWGNIFHWISLFSCSKVSAADIGNIVYKKLYYVYQFYPLQLSI